MCDPSPPPGPPSRPHVAPAASPPAAPAHDARDAVGTPAGAGRGDATPPSSPLCTSFHVNTSIGGTVNTSMEWGFRVDGATMRLTGSVEGSQLRGCVGMVLARSATAPADVVAGTAEAGHN
eukprot:gene54471-54427_t